MSTILPKAKTIQNHPNIAGLASTDALIVGGGPAGLAAAIALRLRGIDCTVVEARPPAIDKACGEGLMPDSQAVLSSLGVMLDETDGHRFRGIRFANASHTVESGFPAGQGLGVRRPHLHRLLAARAEALGARLLWKSHVRLATSALGGDDGRVANINDRPIRYRWLIGADGQASTVRRWAGLDPARNQSVRYGFRTHYRVDTASFDMVEIHWGRGGQLYLTPVAPDCVCVVYLSRDPHIGKKDVLAEFPEIARRLAGSKGLEVVSQQRGAVSATCRLHRVATDHVALVGDASGSADSITGEGLAVSFRQALALADAIAAGSLAGYERAHREIARLPHAMGSLMLTLDRWPRFEAHAMRALAECPDLFRGLMDAHVGARSLTGVLVRRGPGLLWNLLAASVSPVP
ncbi:MAG TPA: FAD-dependent monooxygenase, partial [Acidobacteriaceae bacterium]|nr:FAD-dependent monooxygenase [Acidobacteriaceae bacterium]